jgi:hypothetical protein
MKLLLLLLLSVFTSLTSSTILGGLRRRNVDDGRRVYLESMRRVRRKVSTRTSSTRITTKNDFITIKSVDPVDFGADPTGRSDSTKAFEKATAVLFNVSAYASHDMASGIHNLGGATLDLNGGEYLISEPIHVPPLVGNVRIRGGTLRASESFPIDSFLIEIGGNEVSCVPKDSQGVCNEFVVVEDIFLDSSHVARGGISVNKTMGTTIGPSIFITGFTGYGVQVGIFLSARTSFSLSLSLFLSLSHTYTHTHTHTGKSRTRDNDFRWLAC